MDKRSKCPACGWGVDKDAYRCPKCMIYFCFRCRARVQQDDEQYQCMDQSCEQYGKLLCSACTVMIPEYTKVTKSRLKTKAKTKEEKGISGKALAGSFTLGGGALYALSGLGLFLSIPAAVAVGGAVYGAAKITSSVLGIRFEDETVEVTPSKYEEYEEEQLLGEHRCCIKCKHPIKSLAKQRSKRRK